MEGSPKVWMSGQAAMLVVFGPIMGGCGLVSPITRGFIILLGPSLLEDTGVVT